MNQLKIHRFNGTETFHIQTAWMFTIGSGNDLTLWFEIETTDQGAQPNSDTREFVATPKAELGVNVTHFAPENLVGMQLHHKGTINDDDDSCDALFYYYEHQSLRDNSITIIAQNKPNTFKVNWSARTQDVNDYDGSKPDAHLEIEADFQIKGKVR